MSTDEQILSQLAEINKSIKMTNNFLFKIWDLLEKEVKKKR